MSKRQAVWLNEEYLAKVKKYISEEFGVYLPRLLGEIVRKMIDYSLKNREDFTKFLKSNGGEKSE